MAKQVIIRGQLDINGFWGKLRVSAEQAQNRVHQLAGDVSPLEFLYEMKFHEIGCDPIDSTRQLNLIEQINQTFTYVASLKAANYLLQHHKEFTALTLNLGTTSGWDIESADNGGLVAEVFAAVTPNNNNKLNKDIKKVASAKEKHRYVFFMCPGIKAGLYKGVSVPAEINIISLGCDL